MDKQKLITIAKDQLKGGIGEEQVRDLLTYRGVTDGDADAIMQEALRGASEATDEQAGGDVIAKTDAALKEVSQDTPIDPTATKREWKLLAGASIGVVILVVAGSVIYFLYF